jgi:hypothetical protein
MKKNSGLIRSNFRLARSAWGQLSRNRLDELKSLTAKYRLSLALGDVQLLDRGWYVTNSGLLRLAERRHCSGIHVRAVARFCDPNVGRWVFKATVHKLVGSAVFVGFGDADPSNVSPLVRGAEMRVAETRAVNRALRKAYGIGLCSMEELGWTPRSVEPKSDERGAPPQNGNGNHHPNAQPRLRDRLCLLIRQHKLDPNLVKAYAADYCGTASVRDASRELVEAFINDLGERATKDRNALICHLNGYAKPQEVHS